MSYGPLANVKSKIVNVHKYPMGCNHYSHTLHILKPLLVIKHVWAKRDDPILPALVYPTLPGIGMAQSNCDTLIIAHSHEKLLFAKTLIN